MRVALLAAAESKQRSFQVRASLSCVCPVLSRDEGVGKEKAPTACVSSQACQSSWLPAPQSSQSHSQSSELSCVQFPASSRRSWAAGGGGVASRRQAEALCSQPARCTAAAEFPPAFLKCATRLLGCCAQRRSEKSEVETYRNLLALRVLAAFSVIHDNSYGVKARCFIHRCRQCAEFLLCFSLKI